MTEDVEYDTDPSLVLANVGANPIIGPGPRFYKARLFAEGNDDQVVIGVNKTGEMVANGDGVINAQIDEPQ